jgi:hypothetical protein
MKKEIDKSKLSYYDVKIESFVPATLMFRVLAESQEQAMEKIKNSQPNSVKYKLSKRKDIKIMIYDAGTTLLKWFKNV